MGAMRFLLRKVMARVVFLLFHWLKKGFIMRNNYKKWRFAG